MSNPTQQNQQSGNQDQRSNQEKPQQDQTVPGSEHEKQQQDANKTSEKV